MIEIIVFICGSVVGAVVVYFAMKSKMKDASMIAQEIAQKSEEARLAEYRELLERLRESFYSISLEALDKNLRPFQETAKNLLSEQTALGAKDLEAKKEAVVMAVRNVEESLKQLREKITVMENAHQLRHGQLSEILITLSESTGRLSEAMASASSRGQWGERMAEDVLRLAGFIEGINYFKQETQRSGVRPDFTFPIPPNHKLFMDVKFPFDNFRRYLEAKNENERLKLKEVFLKDVRGHLNALAKREYGSADENALDLVVMFVPNEQIFSFINQHDAGLLDEALAKKIVICSPLTLFAILALIRRAVDNFNLERTASHILTLLGEFSRQWEAFIKSHDKVGERISQLQKEFENLMTTRKNQLQKPLDKIEDLRRQQQLPMNGLERKDGLSLPEN